MIVMTKKPGIEHEREKWKTGLNICGLDEVGRGSLAGPVVAAAVILDKKNKILTEVRDSKKLSQKKRESIYEEILNNCLDFGIGSVSAQIIDQIGIITATKKAMYYALDNLKIAPDHLLIDALYLEESKISSESIIKGDEKCYSIACASIVAKVYRDRLLTGLSTIFPQYYFDEHKGYGTKKHYAALELYGLTPEHRRSFLTKHLREQL